MLLLNLPILKLRLFSFLIVLYSVKKCEISSKNGFGISDNIVNIFKFGIIHWYA